MLTSLQHRIGNPQDEAYTGRPRYDLKQDHSAKLAHAPGRVPLEAALVREIYLSAPVQRYIDREGVARAMSADNILVVALYNVQVNLLKRRLPEGARIGTVDKFQGREAELVIVSMTTSSEHDLPRFMEFLYSKNRLNVAISRAKCRAIVIANPALTAIKCHTPEQMALVNTMLDRTCRRFEMNTPDISQPQQGLPLLTAAEWERLNAREVVDVSGSEEHPFKIAIDAKPLALLAESAAKGHRVHEFMRMDRPGDTLRYLWATMADVDSAVLDRVKASLGFVDRQLYGLATPLEALPFAALDALLRPREAEFPTEDDWPGKSGWQLHRETAYWPAKADALFALVRDLQARLRDVQDPLLRHEIELIDARVHRRAYFVSPLRVDYRGCVPPAESSLPPGLFELIVALARRDDVRSVSCPLNDYPLWRSLVWEQVQRARREGSEPQEAFFLAGPDGGLSWAKARDWGGEIHIPYEGACEADLFIKPDWHVFDAQAARLAGSAPAGLGGKKCRYLLIDSDQGEFAQDERIRCGDWVLYGPKRLRYRAT